MAIVSYTLLHMGLTTHHVNNLVCLVWSWFVLVCPGLPGLSLSVLVCPGLPGLCWAVSLNNSETYWSTLVCPGVSWSVLVFPGLSWSEFVCHGLSWSELVCPGLFWFVLVCLGCAGLSWWPWDQCAFPHWCDRRPHSTAELRAGHPLIKAASDLSYWPLSLHI